MAKAFYQGLEEKTGFVEGKVQVFVEKAVSLKWTRRMRCSFSLQEFTR